MRHHETMRKQKRPHVIFLGFCSHIVSCKSLSIDLPARIHRRNQLQRQARRLHKFRYSQATLRASAEPDFGDGCVFEEQQKNEIVHCKESSFSFLRTAIVAFSAGSLAAIIFSMILFSYSLINSNGYEQAPFSSYQNAGVAKSFSSAQFSEKNDPARANEQKQMAVALYRTILEQLNANYVDELPEPMLLFETTTRAMLSTLDPYTEYVSQQVVTQRTPQVGIGAFVMKAGNVQDSLDGKSVSTILSLVPSAIALPNQLLPNQDVQHSQSQDDGFHVVLSLEGYAYDAGLRVGDEILEIDDQSVVGDSLERVRELLVGVPGTKVKLSFKRPGIEDLKTIYVERNIVQFPNVPYTGILSNDLTLSTKNDGIGYIRLQRFGLDAGISMEKAIRSIQSDKMKGLILDLRDNSGGELLSAVQIASQFFPNDTYLGSSEGKGSLYPNEIYLSGKLDLTQYGYSSNDNFSKSRNSGDDGNIFKDGKQVIDPDKTKIVILTNQRTASASEFLAGAFQDLDKGVIIGSDVSTLGKGIGQREMGLPNGGGALKLTYHEFYTPSGRCVQRQHQAGMNSSPTPKKQDQLKELFYTKNGRVVNDRRGIEVDYRVEPKVSLLNTLLSSSGAYFEFATEFWASHQWSPSGSNGFTVDDQIYSDFKSFVLKEQKRGNLKLEEVFDEKHLLEKIQTLSVESKLPDSSRIQSSVSNLRGKIVQDLLRDFDASGDIIRRELEQNILARQMPDSELIGRSLKSDELVREAVQIIEDTKRYNELLGKNA